MNLKAIYETQKEFIDANPSKFKKKKKMEKQERGRMESTISNAEMSTVQSHYPTDYTLPPTSLNTDEDENITPKNQPVKMKPIESNLNEIALDENRIMHPNSNLSGLYEFVPATKIKGNQYNSLEIQMLETSL